MPCEDEGRGRGDATDTKECQPPEAGGGAGSRLPLSPQKEPTLLAPSPWTSSLCDRQTVHFCWLNCPVCGTLLWQP